MGGLNFFWKEILTEIYDYIFSKKNKLKNVWKIYIKKSSKY